MSSREGPQADPSEYGQSQTPHKVDIDRRHPLLIESSCHKEVFAASFSLPVVFSGVAHLPWRETQAQGRAHTPFMPRSNLCSAVFILLSWQVLGHHPS